MKNTLHIVASSFAAGTIRSFLKKSDIFEKVLFLGDPLKHAPLFKDFSDAELIKRDRSIKEFLDLRDSYDFKTSSYTFVKHDFDKYEKIVIWHGNEVDDLLLLYMVCSLIKRDLYEVDILNIREFFPHIRQNPFIFPVACCSVENIALLYERIKPISPEDKQIYVSLWDKWSKSEAPIRIIDRNNEIQEVNEDYFDEIILSNCQSEFEPVARVIGRTLCDINFLAGDSFLYQRILHLIVQKKLAVCSNKKFTDEIEKSNLSDKNKVIIDQVNVTEMRFFEIKLRAK